MIPKTSRSLVVVPLIVALGLLAWLLFHTRVSEPEYEGRRLTSWLFQYRYWGAGPNADATTQAGQLRVDDAVRHMGTNSIPIFLDMLEAHDGPLKRKVLPLIRKYSPMSFRPLTDQEKNEMALFGFKILGPIAKPAVPALVVMLRDKDSDKYSNKRILAILALYGIGPEAQDAVPALTDCLKDPEEAIRRHATNALQRIDITVSPQVSP